MSQLAGLRSVLVRFDGVPEWWSELFANLGFGPEEASAYLTTSEKDPESVLYALREKELNLTLSAYAAARGISLLGAGTGEDAGGPSVTRMSVAVTTVTTVKEQECIIREVGVYADVLFKEKVKGVYSQHAVANAVRSVHQSFLRRLRPRGATVLEVGASVKAMVLAGVDPENYHGCCPVLCVRDSVRHSLDGWLRTVLEPGANYTEYQRRAAVAAMDVDSGFVCRCKAEECSKQVDMIVSNESTHDVEFDTLPDIMARHGARLWVGFVTRAKGARRIGGPASGVCDVFGTRWRVNKEKDEIVFHFDRDGSFSYTHKFSEWVKYEERFGFRWRGRYFDYVYTRLPITTEACLAFAVARVPKTSVMLSEPVYKPSGLAGMVEVTSIRPVGGCVGSAAPRFEQFVFHMEALVFDRVLETRLSQGDRGNLSSTMAYMRSARVRLVVNGTALGAVASVPVEVLEPAAVAVEVLAADMRTSGARDYDAIMRVSKPAVGVLARISEYFSGLKVAVDKVRTPLRDALARALQGPERFVIKAERCSAYVRLEDPPDAPEVGAVPMLQPSGCGCGELTAVNAALQQGAALGRDERRDLESYAVALRKRTEGCLLHTPGRVTPEDAEDEFFEAEEFVSDASESESVFSGERSVSTVPTTVCSSAVSVEKTESVVASVPRPDKSLALPLVERDTPLSVVHRAIVEYARWAQRADRCARSEAGLTSDVFFLQGNPTLLDVQRSTTARARHAVVAIVDGKVDGVVGTLRDDEEFSEIYVPSLRRTTKVYRRGARTPYISESITELCYTSSRLIVMNGDALCRSALASLQDLPRGYVFPRYVFVNGVPGSGKTWEIKNEMRALLDAGKTVLYLTATKASSLAVWKDVYASDPSKEAYCRTYDSFMINPSVVSRFEKLDMLFMDEASMAHKGELYACMLKANAVCVKYYGDPKQIPWMPFMADFDAEHSVFTDSEISVDCRVVTHRFGAKVCAMWLDVYGEIFPCDCHEHDDCDPEVVPIASSSQVPLLTDGKTLTFTQEEKITVRRETGLLGSVSELKAKDAGGLCTVAEDQGGTHGKVFLVRVVNKKNPKESKLSPSIYNRQPWVLVGTTRQRGLLRYYTTAEDDLVRARFDLAACPVRLAAVRERKSWDEVADEAQKVREFGV